MSKTSSKLFLFHDFEVAHVPQHCEEYFEMLNSVTIMQEIKNAARRTKWVEFLNFQLLICIFYET